NELYLLQTVLREGDIFIDIGANMGIFTLLGAQCVGKTGKVISVEPSTRDYSLLHKNIEDNELSNVIAVKLALSDYVGTAELKIAEDKHRGHNTLGGFIYDTVLLGTETVEVETLPGLLAKLHVHKVDLIKLDTEGAEYNILNASKEWL